MQKGDFIRINYSGKIKETGKIFDKAENVPLVLGEQFVIPGVDEALMQMQIGEKRNVEITPQKGFGERDQNLIKLVPVSEFKRNNIEPYPGMIVNADNLRGRVLSVASGRVKVDFNHPLAGKILVYELELKEKIEDKAEKAKALVEFYTKIPKEKISVNIGGNDIEVVVPPGISALYKKKIADDIRKFLATEKIKFSEVFESPKENISKGQNK